MSLPEERSAQLTRLLLISGIALALFGFLPWGYEMEGYPAQYYLGILGVTFPVSEGFLYALYGITTLLGPIGVGLVLVGLSRVARQTIPEARSGKRGQLLLLLGSCVFFLMGIAAVFHRPFEDPGGIGLYVTIAPFLGAGIYAMGVLLMTANIIGMRTSRFRAGTAICVIGIAFVTADVIFVALSSVMDLGTGEMATALLTLMDFFGIPLIFLGIGIVGWGLISLTPRRRRIARACTALSLLMMWVGAAYLFSAFVPSFNGASVYGPISLVLFYFYTLGMLMALAIAAVVAVGMIGRPGVVGHMRIATIETVRLQ